MEPPTDPDLALAILILRTLHQSQDIVAQVVKRSNRTVGHVERWFADELIYQDAVTFADDQAVKRLVGREFPDYEELEPSVLVRAGQVTGDDILRQYRRDYTLTRIDPRQLKDHVAGLTMVAERLNISLSFPSQNTTAMEESRTGKGYVDGGWLPKEADVYFFGEDDPLFAALLQHLDSEFDTFSTDFQRFKKDALALVTNLDKAREHDLARRLREWLGQVILRTTYLGTCDVCRAWRLN